MLVRIVKQADIEVEAKSIEEAAEIILDILENGSLEMNLYFMELEPELMH